ncbi:MAG: CoA-binding protein [Myxococcota bacterium]
MSDHPLAALLRATEGFVLVGDSSEDRFPALSYAAYTKAGKRFYCVDLGKLPASRGPVKGGKVYHAASELPADHADLAVVWMKPRSAARGVEVAHEAGCKRIWFSFQTGHPEAVAKARSLGMEVVEIGRCPVYYLDDAPLVCRAHVAMVKLSGTYAKPPQTDPTAKRRELI